MQLKGATHTAFLIFFASHIPITLIIDGQSALPSSLYPTALQSLLKFYTTTFKDNLMTAPHPLFFKSFVSCELLFQLPFFMAAVYVLLQPNSSEKKKHCGKGWFRTASLIYGSHTVTTLIPILATIAYDASITSLERGVLFGFYLPYLIFPLWLVVIAALNENIFGDDDNDDNKDMKKSK